MMTRMSAGLAVVLCAGFWAGPAASETWDHVHLTVPDTAAAAEWYAKHFDGKVAKSGPFDAVWFGSKLMKFKRGDVKGSAGSAVDHIAFSVSDVTAKSEALAEDGAEIGRPSRRRRAVALATDPWGTKIELLKDEDLLGFHHVHLKSPARGRTTEWYAKVFGGEPGKFKDVPNINAIRYGDMYVFIQSAVRAVSSTKDRSVDHIGWRVHDFDGTVKRLKDMGVEFLVEPTKSGDHLITFIEGPDGVKIEIVEDTGH